jgi:hypothetical protein
MAVVTIRPNGVYSGVGNYTVTGAATAWQATSDDSDATYIRKDNAISGTASIALNFGTTSIASGQTIRGIRVRSRLATPSSVGKVDLTLVTVINGAVYTYAAYAVRGANTIGEVVGPWQADFPATASTLQQLVDNARLRVTEYRNGSDRGFVYELYIDVDVVTQSTVTVSQPTGTITTTAKPNVEWSVSDPDGDAFDYYQVKVFTEAEYTAAGFDPLTADATWDSGAVNSNDTFATVETYLLNGNHRAYVRSGKTVNGKPFWSPFAFSGFTMNLSPPTAPTLTTSYNTAQNSVTITATGAAAIGFDSQTFEVQRSDDAGAHWVTVRYASALIPDTTHTAIIVDQEPARGVTVQYRARAIGVLGQDVQASDWGTVASEVTTNDGSWIIKTLARTPIIITNARVVGANDYQVDEQIGTFRPLGRSYPVVLSQAIGGEDGTLNVVTIGQAEYDTLHPLIVYRGTLLVQDPFGSQQYIRVTDRNIERDGAATNPRHTIELRYLEVQG